MTQNTKRFFAIVSIAILIGIIISKKHFHQNNHIDLSKRFDKTLFEGKEGESESKLQRVGNRMQQEFEKIRNPTTLTIPTNALIKAKNATERLLQSLGGRNNVAVADLDWQNRGPSNVAGRTRAILFDLNDATNNTVFAGSVAGGLWKSTNFQSNTPNWIPVNDFFENIAITAIIQDHNNPSIMYFGTGEGWNNFDAARGLGIWKSTDGGDTWAQLGYTATRGYFRYIQDLLIDNNGNLYASTRARGVQRSTNGGDSFQTVIGSRIDVGPNNLATDLELGPDGDIYAALGIHSTGAVFHSAGNLGANTGAAGNWTDITPTGSFRRIELATAASQSGRVYALCQGNGSNDVTDIFRTDNHGVDWTSGTVPIICNRGDMTTFTREQAWYNLIAGVDPTNADRIYIGGIDGLRSDDGGSTWTPITSWDPVFDCNEIKILPTQFVHADQHAMVFEPGNSNKIVLGTDGGLFHTLDGTVAAPTFLSKNKDLNITQFYGVAIHPDIASSYFLAGAQDNGTHKFNAPGYSSTVEVTGGDGGIPHIDQDDPTIQITAFTYNGYHISTDGGTTFERGARSTSGRFINPSDYDNSANMLYAAADNNEYFRWEDPATGGDANSTLTVNELGGQVSAVFTSPNVDNRVYFGTGEGTIVRVDDAHTGADGTAKAGTLLLDVDGYVSSIEAQTGNENHLLATISSYGEVSVYESVDGGSNWINIEGNLPDIPVRWGIFNPTNPNEVLLATELGVWSATNLNGAATVWMPTNANLANVRIDMLQYRATDDIIVAASHGRGLYVVGGAVPSCTDGVRNGMELGVDCGCDCPNSCGNSAPAETIETAIEITTNGTYNTDGATTGNGCYGCEESTHADWYSFTAPENGTIDISSCGGGSESRLYIHEGTCGFLNTIASDADKCSTSREDSYAAVILGIPVECGKTYYFEWDDRWDDNAFAFTFAYTMTSACDEPIPLTEITLNDVDLVQPADPETEYSELVGSVSIGGAYLQMRTEGGGDGAKFLVRSITGTPTVVCDKITFRIRSQEEDVVAFDVTIGGDTQSFDYTSLSSSTDVYFDFDIPITFTNTVQELEVITTALTNSGGATPRFRIYDLTFHLTENPGSTCETDLNLTTAIDGGTFQASNEITSNSIIANDTTVIFEANAITLTAGFQTGANTTFIARIAPCTALQQVASTSRENNYVSNLPKELNTLRAYPNPTTAMLTVQGDFTKPLNYTIHTLQGQQLQIGQLTANTEQIDISNLPPNIYLIRVGEQVLKIVKIE